MGAAEQKRPAGRIKGAVQELAQDVATLCIHPVYISTIAGQTLYTGALLPCTCKASSSRLNMGMIS